MSRVIGLTLLSIGLVAASGCGGRVTAEPGAAGRSAGARFDEILARHADLTYEQLFAATPQAETLERLPFDPSLVKFYDETVERLQLTDEERELLQSNGFVSVDHDQRYSFGSLYYAVYTFDLPVLVTTDSILHAMHRTYDDLLMELEQSLFANALDEVLATMSRASLPALAADGDTATNDARRGSVPDGCAKSPRWRGAPKAASVMVPHEDGWDGALMVNSVFDQNDAAKEILDLVQAKTLQNPGLEEFTVIYGGRRRDRLFAISAARALSEIGVAGSLLSRHDVAEPGGYGLERSAAGSAVDDRQRRAARGAECDPVDHAATVVRAQVERLRQVNSILDFLVGESDNLTIFQLSALLDEEGIGGADNLASDDEIGRLQKIFRERGLGAAANPVAGGDVRSGRHSSGSAARDIPNVRTAIRRRFVRAFESGLRFDPVRRQESRPNDANELGRGVCIGQRDGAAAAQAGVGEIPLRCEPESQPGVRRTDPLFGMAEKSLQRVARCAAHARRRPQRRAAHARSHAHGGLATQATADATRVVVRATAQHGALRQAVVHVGCEVRVSRGLRRTLSRNSMHASNCSPRRQPGESTPPTIRSLAETSLRSSVGKSNI